MTAIEFYQTTANILECMAKQYGICDLEKYYHLTDFISFPQLKDLGEIQQTYMQIAFHGQNATMISNIVKFKENYSILEQILCGFDPNEIKKKFAGHSRTDSVSKMIETFQSKGIIWNENKSTKRPNAIMTRYANLLLDAADYLEPFHTKNEVIDDLMDHYHHNNVKELVTYFRSKIKSGFSIALTCDFLKEYADAFSNLPKPDIHIKDTLCVLNGLEDNYYRTEKREYECIKHLQDLVEEINRVLKTENKPEITVYQLDRMIWLICSNKFFLDFDTGNSKDFYLSKIV